MNEAAALVPTDPSVPASPDVAPLAQLDDGLRGLGLARLGAFHPEPADGVPLLPDGAPTATLIMAGHAGSSFWPQLQAAPEAGGPDPIDRWSARVLRMLARQHGAAALFPSDGPPWHPFQRWAQRADPELATSPIGILIHPDHGLWHALRGALLFRERLALPPRAVPARPSPCASCAEKPCLGTCPVGAFTPSGYAVRACRSYLATLSGQPCMIQGCAARRACPIGRRYIYSGSQMQHHMRAFARG